MQEQIFRDEVAELIEKWLSGDRTRTLKQLAWQSGVSPQYVSSMRLGMCGVGLKQICKLLDYLGYDLEIVKKG